MQVFVSSLIHVFLPALSPNPSFYSFHLSLSVIPSFDLLFTQAKAPDCYFLLLLLLSNRFSQHLFLYVSRATACQWWELLWFHLPNKWLWGDKERGKAERLCTWRGGSRSSEISRNIRSVWVCLCECVSKEKRQQRWSSWGHHNVSAYQPATLRLHLRPPLTASSRSAVIGRVRCLGSLSLKQPNLIMCGIILPSTCELPGVKFYIQAGGNVLWHASFCRTPWVSSLVEF